MGRSSLVIALVFAGCWTPTPPDGAYACNPSGKASPDGYSCVGGSCWKNGHGPDMGIGPTCTNGAKDDVESDVEVLGSGVTDSNGALVAPINFNVPNTTPATYKIFVIDDRSRYPVNVSLTVM